MRSSSKVISLGSVAVLAGASPTRRTLTFFPASQDYFVAPDGIVPSATAGWQVLSTGGPLVISQEFHGDVVQHPWSAFSIAGTSFVQLETSGNFLFVGPKLVFSVDVAAGGAGGRSGAGAAAQDGGGGGGAEYAATTAVLITPGNNYFCAVAVPGVGGVSNFPGDAVTVQANSGSDGVDGAGGGAGGAGGVGGIGAVLFAGGAGANGGLVGAGGGGGGGGAGATAVGGAGVLTVGGAGNAPGGNGGNGGVAAVGNPGSNFGGGAGGGGGLGNAGDLGGTGFVQISYSVPASSCLVVEGF